MKPVRLLRKKKNGSAAPPRERLALLCAAAARHLCQRLDLAQVRLEHGDEGAVVEVRGVERAVATPRATEKGGREVVEGGVSACAPRKEGGGGVDLPAHAYRCACRQGEFLTTRCVQPKQCRAVRHERGARPGALRAAAGRRGRALPFARRHSQAAEHVTSCAPPPRPAPARRRRRRRP